MKSASGTATDEEVPPATPVGAEQDQDQPGVELQRTPTAHQDEEPAEEERWEEPAESYHSRHSADFVQSNPTLRAWMRQQGSHYRFDDVNNEGPTVYGDHAKIFNIGKDDQVRLTADPVRRIKLKVATFVTPASFKDLKDRLERSRVVGLAGPVGSGRMTAACAALAARYGQENIREIVLPDSIEPLRIRDQRDLLQKGCGYVVRLGGDSTAGVIRALEWTFEQQEASAVLLRDLDAPGDSPHHAEVFHKFKLEPVAVFRRHLVYNLHGRCVDDCPDCDKRCGIRYARMLVANEVVRQGIKLLARPRECAHHAELIASRLPRSPEAVIALLPSGDKRRRVRARAILETPVRDDGYQNRQLQHRRALRLSYAVFSGHPIAHVTDAAGLLLGKLDELFTHPAIGRPALVHSLPMLLGDDLAANWDGDDEPADGFPSDMATRIAQAEPELVRALLDVAWNDFDNSRATLIDWIDALATHPTGDFEQSAAVAAAGFACHDFDQVYGTVIGRWARDRKRTLRRAAAAALVAAANLAESAQLGTVASRRISSQVNGRLYSLARSDAAFERDTAAKAWSMGFRPPYRSRLLRDLTHVARNANGYLGYEVAEAVSRLAEGFGHAPMVALLKEWAVSEDPALEAAAGRSFRLLIASEMPLLGRHPVLSIAGSSPSALEDVAMLWRLVLLDSQLAEAGWRQLAHWLRAFAPYPPTADTIRALLRALALDQGVRPRFAYWLSHAGTASTFASAA